MNKIKMFLIALVAMVCSSVNAQTATETFNFPKMTDIPTGAWTINQKLDGVSIVRKKSNLTMTFATADGKKAPEYAIDANNKGEDVQAACLLPGNTLTISTEKKNIVSVQFYYLSKSKAAIGKNYQITPEGTYPGEKAYTYIWTGKTQKFELKNLTNKAGIEIHKIVVTYEDAE